MKACDLLRQQTDAAFLNAGACMAAVVHVLLSHGLPSIALQELNRSYEEGVQQQQQQQQQQQPGTAKPAGSGGSSDDEGVPSGCPNTGTSTSKSDSDKQHDADISSNPGVGGDDGHGTDDGYDDGNGGGDGDGGGDNELTLTLESESKSKSGSSSRDDRDTSAIGEQDINQVSALVPLIPFDAVLVHWMPRAAIPGKNLCNAVERGCSFNASTMRT